MDLTLEIQEASHDAHLSERRANMEDLSPYYAAQHNHQNKRSKPDENYQPTEAVFSTERVAEMAKRRQVLETWSRHEYSTLALPNE